AKSVHDAGWSAFVGMLEYKAVKHGRTFAKVDRAFPSSQVCAACGLGSACFLAADRTPSKSYRCKSGAFPAFLINPRAGHLAKARG
ncbi:zinc ribbon domain-containing protein, partial [Streptomyces sp. NPDC056291]|uniref:zinc ribbon domain-containing protein n=1 Tax=Streptomyces sp. NPDC056291 TaxID=3345772 RepID=UPI0035DAFD13